MAEQTSQTTPPAQAPPVVDQFVTDLAASLGVTVTPDLPKPVEPVNVGIPSTRSLSEVVVETQDRKAAEAKEGTPAAPAAATPPAETKPEEKVEVSKPEADKLKEELNKIQSGPLPAATATPPAQTPPAQAPAAGTDDDYVKGLTPDQQYELDLAKLAESKGQTGAHKKLLDFYKDVDKFCADNPGASEVDLQEFADSKRPEIKNRHRVEIDYAVSQTEAKLRAEHDKTKQESAARARALELKPQIEKAVDTFSNVLVQPKGLPEGVIPMDPDVAEAIRKDGYESALKRFPIEAPVFKGTVDATREYLNIVNGITPFKPQENDLHAWIGNFVARQEQIYMQQPADKRVVNGKAFLPAHDLTELYKTKPEEAAKHWTFSNDYILDMFAANAHLTVSAKVKELEEAGFVRPQKAKKENSTPPVQQQSSAPSPKAGASALPGSAPSTKPIMENAEFMERLLPGASARI